MKNVFDADDVSEVLNRIQGLTPSSEPQWGKMNVAQMLAHCNVTYEMALEDKHAKPNILMRMLLKVLVKKAVVNTKPYPPQLAHGSGLYRQRRTGLRGRERTPDRLRSKDPTDG